jgi:hypothetical protein
MGECEDTLAFVTDVLEILDLDSDYGDLHDAVFTIVRNRRIVFMVNANDLFYWACADGEDITPENLPALTQAVTDVRSALGVSEQPVASDAAWDRWYTAGGLGAKLFAARIRGLRPQRPYYASFPASLHPLFDACGPERDPKDEG